MKREMKSYRYLSFDTLSYHYHLQRVDFRHCVDVLSTSKHSVFEGSLLAFGESKESFDSQSTLLKLSRVVS
jgi:hypothetical protein